MATSTALQAELAHQAQRFGEQASAMVNASYQNAESVVYAIQQMSDYLGGGLCEVRWVLERHTQVSVQILRILLESLDNTSRQYFEQGIKWYEKEEHELAKDRFKKALEANLTNYFAYQYLGFIAVAQNESDQAIRNFDLAQKTAEQGYHRALALSHLARCYQATGDLAKAVTLANEATQSNPETAKFWYELAGYCARLGRELEAVESLKKAIAGDWTYFTIAAIDNDFDSMRAQVDALLEQLRARQRNKAQESIDKLNRAIETARRVGVTNGLEESIEDSSDLEERFKQDNVFNYNQVIPEAEESHERTFRIAETTLQGRIDEKKKQIPSVERDKYQRISELDGRVSKLENSKSDIALKSRSWTPGCAVGALVGLAGFVMLASHRVTGMEEATAVEFMLIGPFLTAGLIRLGAEIWHAARVSGVESAISAREREIAPLKEKVLEEHNRKSTKLDEEITELERLLEHCRNRHYV